MYTEGPLCIAMIHENLSIREWVRLFIEEHPQLLWVGSVQNTVEAIPLIKEGHPQVLIMGLTSLEPSFLDSTRIFLQTFPHIQFIACSYFKSEEVRIQLAQMGFADHLLNPFTSIQLLKSIHSVVPPTQVHSPLLIEDQQV